MVRVGLAAASVLIGLGCGPGADEVSPLGDSGSPGPSSGSSPTDPASSTSVTTTTGTDSGGSSSLGTTSSSTETSTTGTSMSDVSTGDTTAAGSTGTGVGCTLPVLIHDPFDNGDPDTGGAGAINGGVRYADNNVTNGTLVEVDGVARVSTPLVDSGAAPNVGIESTATFDGTTAAGVTAVAVIEAADTPIWQGIVLAIHSDEGFYETAGAPGLELHVFSTPATGAASHDDSVVLIGETTSDHDYADLSYDPASLNDGFVVAISADPSGWTLRAEGLTADDAPLTASGTWDAGFGYADLLDAESYAAVAIQGTPGDSAPRTLDVGSLTVYAGTCVDNVIPEPA